MLQWVVLYPRIHGQHKPDSGDYEKKKNMKFREEIEPGRVRGKHDQNVLYGCMKFTKNKNIILK